MKKLVLVLIMTVGVACFTPQLSHASSKYESISHTLNRDIGSKLCKMALGVNGTFGRALAVIALIIVGFSLFFAPFVHVRMASVTFIAILVASMAMTLSAGSIVDMVSGQVIMGFDGTFSNCANSMLDYYKDVGNQSEYARAEAQQAVHGLGYPGDTVVQEFTKY